MLDRHAAFEDHLDAAVPRDDLFNELLHGDAIDFGQTISAHCLLFVA